MAPDHESRGRRLWGYAFNATDPDRSRQIIPELDRKFAARSHSALIMFFAQRHIHHVRDGIILFA